MRTSDAQEPAQPEDLFPHGYGRAWSEPKATGIARLFQISREPCTKTALYWIGGVSLAVYAALLWLTAWLFA